ncbi:MAG TPA: DnaJ domain-containing protein [Candidatus Limnocylindrales bacterium]|nr:DnaJ domain-containing protein [Candidatus Limnocylindrales bacterium]
MGDDEPSPYAVLQVDPAAEDAVVRAAYRALARRYHPDMGHPESRRLMVRLNRAWELLGDPNRRAETDRLLRERTSTAGSATPGEGGLAARAGACDDRRDPDLYTPMWLQRQPNRRVVNGWGSGAAGPPPGRPSGSIIDFGIYRGWSLGEVLRGDPGYLAWLADRPEGQPYHAEIRALGERAAGQATGNARPARRRRFGFG